MTATASDPAKVVVAKAVQLGMVRSYMESLELYELRAPWLRSSRREPVGTG